MPFEDTFTIRQLALNASTFTNVEGATIPIDCSNVIVFNNSAIDIVLRSDPALAISEAPVPAGDQFEVIRKSLVLGNRNSFTAGHQVCALKAASGTPTILVFCIR